jgi:ubiquinone/menaquinone biosynthesis C-methylase UbiE
MQGREFQKYAARGAYHWEALRRSVRRHNPYLAGRYALTLELLDKAGVQGDRALDIGCGDGALSFLLARDGWRVAGLDYSGAGLGLAREMFGRHGEQAGFMRGDSTMLPVKDGSQDAVVAADIIEHLREPERMLDEIARALKKGGAAVITTPVKMTDTPVDPEHVREFTEDEFRRMLAARFSDVEILLSHPADVMDRYNRTYRIFGVLGRLRPYRYIYNIMSCCLGMNPFLSAGRGGGYTQMSALCRK